MTAWRSYRRDLDLPALAGDSLRVASPEEVVALATRELLRDGAPSIVSATMGFVRWKPHVSLVASYAVEFADGLQHVLTIKRYAGDKFEGRARHYTPDGHVHRAFDRLRPFAVIEADGACLYSFPADRVLSGLGRLVNLRRTARVLNAEPWANGSHVRGSKSTVTLLRYKPEHRAVFRLDLGYRDVSGAAHPERLAARVLEPTEARRVCATRRAAFAGNDGPSVPKLLALDERAGLLFEAWVQGEVSRHDDFTQADAAGRVLARLHASQHGGAEIIGGHARAVHADHDALFAADPALLALARGIERPPLPATLCWVHGDFHPDQLCFESDAKLPTLLDLDNLHYGCAPLDLASWIAGHLAADPRITLEAAAEPLLEGYLAEGGVRPRDGVLRAWVAAELCNLAAGSLRRLEHGGVAKARACLNRARSLVSKAGAGA